MNKTPTSLVSDGVAVSAYAKLNLTLEVLGKRPDGYHAIRSIVVPVGLHDDVVVSVSGDGADGDVSLEVVADGADISRIGATGDNLAVRAARLFMERTGCHVPLAIRIVKRIPIGGGLGGGSADAAAVLVGLNSLVTRHPSLVTRHSSRVTPLSTADLMEMAAMLGSDIPSLVHGGTVVMEGRGEKVRPLAMVDGRSPIPALPVVLANPGVFVSTAEAYRAVRDDLTDTPILGTIYDSVSRGMDFASVAAALRNDLEDAVLPRHPEIADLAAAMRGAGARAVLMSGSGATVFALAEDDEEAERIMRALPAGCWRTLTRLLPDGVMAAHGPLEA